MAKMSKEELQELQDAGSWEEPGEVVLPAAKPPRAVVSVAFSRDDFETIADHAKKHGMKISEFIRHAALELATPKPHAPVSVTVTGSVYTGYATVSAPRPKLDVRIDQEPPVYSTA